MYMNLLYSLGAKTFSSLMIRNYRLYFIGQIISQGGSWMQVIAQDWLVLSLTGSGVQLGIVTALQYLPMLLFAPLGGLIADRFSKTKLLYFTQITWAVLALGLGILTSTGIVELWMVYIFALCFGLVNAIYGPARLSFVYEMVGKDDIANAVTLNSIQFNIGRIVGPAVAGVLIAFAGLAICFYINAISYFALITALLLMNSSELSSAPLVAKTKGQLREGLKYIYNTPIILNTLLVMAIIGTFAYEFSVSLPLIAKFTFHGDASSYASLTIAMGAGAVIGGLLTASRVSQKPTTLYKIAAGFGVSILFASIAPNIHVMAAALVITGIFSISLTSVAHSILQLNVVPEMRGRVMSMWNVAILGSTPIGGPIIGFIGQATGPRWALATGGLACLAAAAYGVFTIMRDK